MSKKKMTVPHAFPDSIVNRVSDEKLKEILDPGLSYRKRIIALKAKLTKAMKALKTCEDVIKKTLAALEEER